jgi:hypothetical protein
MNEGEKRSRRRVRFDSKVPARMMGIDGTWQRECVVDDISDGGAKLTVSGSIGNLPLQEFFAGAVLNRARLSPLQARLGNGEQIGVSFQGRMTAKRYS